MPNDGEILPPGVGVRSGNNDEDGATGDNTSNAQSDVNTINVTEANKQQIKSAEDAAAIKRGVIPLEITSLISGKTVPIYGTMTSLNDNWSSNYNEEVVYGRIDAIPTFSNTARTISVSIDLVPITANGNTIANSSKTNQITISEIAKMCYPGYQTMSTAGGNINFNAAILKSAPLVEIQHRNVICSADGGPLKAFIKSFTTNIQYDGLYSLAGATSTTTTATQLSIYYNRISITLEFGILHDEPMGYDESGDPKGNFGSYPYFFPIGGDD